MSQECIDQKILNEVLEKLNKQEQEARQARRKKVLKIATYVGVAAVVVLGGWALFGLATRNKAGAPKRCDEWGSEPVSLTYADNDVENMPMVETDLRQGPFDHQTPDWIHVQEESDDWGNSNGTSTFYGYNVGGLTDWYTPDGFLDCTTSTPSEDDPKWATDIWEGNITRFDEV